MDYEKKYKEALERAKDMLAYKEVRQEDMEYLFPELEESEGERIRKAIITYISHDQHCGVSNAEMIAWLEKQGENKKLDADKVIAWLVTNICYFEYYIKLFKEDFELC